MQRFLQNDVKTLLFWNAKMRAEFLPVILITEN